MSAADAAVIGSATMLGLASIPHCAAMCGSACALLTRRAGGAKVAFHLGRLAAYASAGAVAAVSAGAIASWVQASGGLMALWTLMHAGIFALGGYLLVAGRMPALASLGGSTAVAAGWQAVRGPGSLGAGLAGLAWVAWPCVTLQGALLVSALASGAVPGALAMAGFAVASGTGLWLAPQLLKRISARHALRLAGALIVAASTWALAHDLGVQQSAWCMSPSGSGL